MEKRACYQNHCIDSNQILHSDKDHQMRLVGAPNTRITNPRWRTATIVFGDIDLHRRPKKLKKLKTQKIKT